MNAIEALQALRDGKKIRHIRADEGEYWYIKKMDGWQITQGKVKVL